MSADTYIGRFAPSPTGPLHFGSLVTALASYLDSRQHRGQWLIRIEDIDGTRCQPEHASHILQTLASYGLESDRPPVFQSDRLDLYQQQLEYLHELDQLYPCNCTRAQLQTQAGLHPTRCDSQTSRPHSWRLACPANTFHLHDPIQGNLHLSLTEPANDPVLKRKDGYFSYQLAVVVDDHLQGITHIVRGADLIDTTAQQLYLYQLLGWQAPTMTHLPLIMGSDGRKLSKQNHAKPIPMADLQVLRKALAYLKINADEAAHSTKAILESAIPQWSPQRLTPHNIELSPPDLASLVF
jgi:glutamyl-Q tRNA(Asp) synthetase